MAIKDRLAKMFGPKGYGSTLGRTAFEGATALANSLFLSHGISQRDVGVLFFDDGATMNAAGFGPRYDQVERIDLSTLTPPEQVLLVNLHTAMVAFSYLVHLNAAQQYMQRDNASQFNKGLVPSLVRPAIDCGLFHDTQASQVALDPYLAEPNRSRYPVVLNHECPASDDILRHLVVTAANRSDSNVGYGFARSGPTGFDITATAIVGETLRCILAAARQYDW